MLQAGEYRAVYMEDLANVDALLKLLNEESEMQWDRILTRSRALSLQRCPAAAERLTRISRKL